VVGFVSDLEYLSVPRPSDAAEEDPWTLDSSSDVQGLIFDHGGSLRPSLLAFEPQESGNVLKSWRNDGTGFTL